MEFSKTKINDSTKPIECKFCHEPVWYHDGSRRFYNIGGETFHSCENSKEFYKNQGYQRAQNRRNRRF